VEGARGEGVRKRAGSDCPLSLLSIGTGGGKKAIAGKRTGIGGDREEEERKKKGGGVPPDLQLAIVLLRHVGREEMEKKMKKRGRGAEKT